jgi:NAD(P)-dependent dehydrogenase (short-subunit alcohol dehydrogenase family)
MKKTVLITGASSGFGRETVKLFHKNGWNVVATMRSPEKETELNTLSNVFVSKLDVTDKATIKNTVAQSIEKFGSIDVLVNNAGYGAMGALEAATEQQIKQQFDVNLFGLIAVTQAVLPGMREHKTGIIINVSSVGGRLTFPFSSLYHATKFALEGLTESMQYELNPLGEVAGAIYEAATDGTEKLRYPVGHDAVQLLQTRPQMDDADFKKMMASQLGL